ncbi:hypothetical protein EVA_14945, partial [gut metagenome]
MEISDRKDSAHPERNHTALQGEEKARYNSDTDAAQ